MSEISLGSNVSTNICAPTPPPAGVELHSSLLRTPPLLHPVDGSLNLLCILFFSLPHLISSCYYFPTLQTGKGAFSRVGDN